MLTRIDTRYPGCAAGPSECKGVCTQDVDNTGKRSLPRIVVLPEFIASEKISADCKDFYRKSSNSFLRTDLLRTRGYE
jgi:hypothetical protein